MSSSPSIPPLNKTLTPLQNPLSCKPEKDLRISRCFTPFVAPSQTQFCSEIITKIMVLAIDSHLSFEARSQGITSILKGINKEAQVLSQLSARLNVEVQNLPKEALVRHPALVCDILLEILPFKFQVSLAQKKWVNIAPNKLGTIITLCIKIAGNLTLKLEEKASQINRLLAQSYTSDQLDCVYDALYFDSKDSPKTGGREWSKSHICDNPTLLCNVLLDHLPSDSTSSLERQTQITEISGQNIPLPKSPPNNAIPFEPPQNPYKKYLLYGALGVAALAMFLYKT